MAGKHYTDRQKAAAWAELAVNDGNVKRTARNLGIPISTVRRWRDEWQDSGLSDEVSAEVAPIIADFMQDAVRIRGKLLLRLEEMLENEQGTMAQVSTAFGILSDKVRAYEAVNESRRVEHTVVLPPAEELKALFSGLLEGVVESARVRAAEIEAMEEPFLTTYRELPVATEE